MAITVTLPDGKALQLPDGATGADAAAAIGPGLARAALAIEVGRRAARPRARRCPTVPRVAISTAQSGEQALALIRHDAAHVLAAAVLELYPGVKISIGPAIDGRLLLRLRVPAGGRLRGGLPEDRRAYARAREGRGGVPARGRTPARARELFVAEEQDYKVELIDDLVAAPGSDGPLQSVSLYTNGAFTDLCRGPHAPTTKSVGAFKLQSVAGAYWRGDSSRTMLTRIYGTAFFSKAELQEHLERLEQAKARDHRKLGRELSLFTFSDISPGAAFWLPAGASVFNELVALSRRMAGERGYSEIKTPQIFDAELWKTSGHWEKYRDHMFTVEVENREMGVKPMNCPGHAFLFASRVTHIASCRCAISSPACCTATSRRGCCTGCCVFATSPKTTRTSSAPRSRWAGR